MSEDFPTLTDVGYNKDMETTEEIEDMRKALIALQEARNLIVEKGWTQNFYARNADGVNVCIGSKEATCYCAMGAMHTAFHLIAIPCETNWDILALTKLENELPEGNKSIPYFNDLPETTAKDIQGMFDRAITKLEAQLQ